MDVISFQKIFGLCGLKCHIVEIWRDVTLVHGQRTDGRNVKIGLEFYKQNSQLPLPSSRSFEAPHVLRFLDRTLPAVFKVIWALGHRMCHLFRTKHLLPSSMLIGAPHVSRLLDWTGMSVRSVPAFGRQICSSWKISVKNCGNCHKWDLSLRQRERCIN